MPDGRRKAKRRVCPRAGCGRVWYVLHPDEPDLCPACRQGAPLAVVGSSGPRSLTETRRG